MSGEHHGKPTAVPSFASFKKQEPLKTPSGAEKRKSATESAREPDGFDDHGRRSRSKRHHNDRQHQSSSSHRKHSEPVTLRHREHAKDSFGSPLKPADELSRSHTTVSALATEQQDKYFDQLYVIDRRGDPLILRYGSNDRSKVPVYRRGGRGRVLGQAVGFLETDRVGSKEVFVIRSARERGSLFREKNVLQLKSGNGLEKNFIPRSQDRSVAPVAPEEIDFLPITNPNKRKRGQDDEDRHDGRFGPNGSPLRMSGLQPSEQGASDNETTSDEDQMLDVDDDDDNDQTEGQEQLQDTKKRLIELSRRVKEHPEDVDAWLALIKLQETRLHFDANEAENETFSRGVAEVKLSMFDSALKHSQSEVDRERLLLGVMREGRHIWTPKVLTKRWELICKEHPRSFLLWRAYLDHLMTDVASFGVDEIRGFFQRRLDFLRAEMYLAASKASATQELVNLCEQSLYVFLRVTRYLQDSGFFETAVALWQAILELTFCRPSELVDSSAESCLLAFRDFWESEVPRFGEQDHQGWNAFASSDQDVPDPRMLAPPEPPKSRDVYKAWASSERQRCLDISMPARAVDQDAVEDPLRVVMYSDIESFLFVIPSSIVPHVRAQVAEALSQFCRLSSTSDPHGLIQAARDDQFICGSHVHLQAAVDLRASEQTSVTLVQDHGPKKAPQFLHDEARMAFSTDLLVASSDWFSYGTTTAVPDIPRDFHDWTSNTIQELALKHKVEELGELHLSLQWSQKPQNAKKTAKGLLKLYPTNTELYKAYAYCEYCNGNLDLAESVLLSAASQKLSTVPGETQSLWNALVWVKLQRTNLQNAAVTLCSSAGDSPGTIMPTDHLPQLTPTQILKGRQSFQTARDYQLSSGNVVGAVAFAEASVLLAYLTTKDGEETYSAKQGNLLSAVASVMSFSNELCARSNVSQSSSHERFLQFASKLLYFHAKNGSFRPAFLRETFSHFVKLFPRNTMFLSLFAWAESSLRLDDPVRRLLQRSILVEQTDTISARIFAIRHEIRVGNAYSARAAFEQALATDRFAGDPHLWIAYVRFCCSQRELRSKAKGVFYRAMAACPWSKEVIMEGFGDGLIRDMASDELRALYTTMSARGLRIHVDMDEFVEEWRKRKHSGR
ncbi:hypothetical protein PpBr36_00393 [Pyricularia pennisetigena]|uniref:hypothetical protein n=1 Tax=Pyricularia pennisetigena TaxID=1578925 RepID=UPI0011511C86|nr:hypothetical protein PpBr36_00393 [Pyricularia pennisetigena]TLS29563.1 hypothetical protein PpBr36_00393 [Pyricularia pennisetigena]